jgi:hypothetical protein
MPIVHTLGRGKALDYHIEWEDWLDELAPGSIIDTKSWSIDSAPAGFTIVTDRVIGTRAFVWVSASGVAAEDVPAEVVLQCDVTSLQGSDPTADDTRYITISLVEKVFAQAS